MRVIAGALVSHRGRIVMVACGLAVAVRHGHPAPLRRDHGRDARATYATHGNVEWSLLGPSHRDLNDVVPV